jgi:nuclear transport factor 2 (NTF2) superfamily protein
MIIPIAYIFLRQNIPEKFLINESGIIAVYLKKKIEVKYSDIKEIWTSGIKCITIWFEFKNQDENMNCRTWFSSVDPLIWKRIKESIKDGFIIS